MLNIMYIILSFVIGAVIGWLASKFLLMRDEQRIKEDLYKYKIRLEEIEGLKRTEDQVKEEIKHIFNSLASDISKKNTEDFLKIASDKFQSLSTDSNKSLDEKKKLIDTNLDKMNKRLDRISEQSVRLSTNIEDNKNEVERLSNKTTELNKILSSSQRRGKWGERMVDDILSVIGLIENINYKTQTSVDSNDSSDIPDYTFILPREKSLNMDVKFPLDNYERYLSADSEELIDQFKKLFLKDIKAHIDEVSKRGYINSKTLDYVLIFIPNESIYGFINKENPQLIDHALSKKILLCSPLTLYAILSLIHQSSKNFAIEERAQEILGYMQQFKKQWDLYVASMDTLGKRLESTRKEYETLISTRTNMLKKPLDKIDSLSTSSSDLIEEEIAELDRGIG